MYHIIGVDGQSRGPIDAATLAQWIAEGRANGQTQTCPEGGSEWKPLAYYPEFATALSQAPPAPPTISSHTSESDATGGLIPYKNKLALIGYYMGVFSLVTICLPIFGLLLTIPTLVLGIKGLRKVNENPAIKGKAHAWVAIVLGALLTVGHLVFLIFAIIGIIKS